MVMSVSGQVLLALATGVAPGLVGVATVLAVARRRGLFSSVDAATEPCHEGTAPPAAIRRDRWQLTGIATLALLALLAMVYAWSIGFGGYGGIVEAKSVSSLGRHGDYTLRIAGEHFRVSRAVNALAGEGSTVVRPRAQPYVLVDGEAVVMSLPLVALGLVGTLLTCLWALLQWLTWWRPPG